MSAFIFHQTSLNPIRSPKRRTEPCSSTDPPSSPMIYTRNYVVLGQKNTLICHVTGFYPAPVNVSWTKNEQKVTEGTSINKPYPKTDGTFDQISRLDFIPEQGDIYSCSVQHPALDQPVTRLWGENLNFTSGHTRSVRVCVSV